MNKLIKQLEDLADEHYSQYVMSFSTMDEIAQYHLGLSNGYSESLVIINKWLDNRINEIMSED